MSIMQSVSDILSAEPLVSCELPRSSSEGRGALSVIIPAKNEEQNLPVLIARLLPVLHGLDRPFEVLVVNDGSTDGSLRVLRALALPPRVRIIDLSRNYGQTAAMTVTLDHATAEISSCRSMPICKTTPPTFRMLLAKLDEGYDVVSVGGSTAGTPLSAATSSAVSPTG